MVVKILTFDRGDRPEFLTMCKKIAARQTYQCEHVVVDYPPVSDKKDLVPRFRKGMELCADADLVVIMESDDWYADNYVQTMVEKWLLCNKPMIIGVGEASYFHIGTGRRLKLDTKQRSSLFTTALRPQALKGFKWPEDEVVFLDLYLWKQIRGMLFNSGRDIAVGIKHGMGVTGGKGHDVKWSQTWAHNPDFLTGIVSESDLEFYSNVLKS